MVSFTATFLVVVLQSPEPVKESEPVCVKPEIIDLISPLLKGSTESAPP